MTILNLAGILFTAATIGQSAAFPFGLAAGDVTDSTAVLWTQTAGAGTVRLDVARDAGFNVVAHSTMLTASADTGFNVKNDAIGLAPATRYFYRFVRLSDGAASTSGTFRTAPRPADAFAFRFVFTGDSNAATQPFRLLSFLRDEAPDLWFWLGDTIYADADAGGLGEAQSLDQYREKYRQNLADPHLQALLSSTATWAGWDDHEVTNDYDGADPEPGLGRAQIDDGYRAFFESIPIRPQNIAGDERRIYRSFRYGALAEFFILDGRQYRSADAARVVGGGVATLDPFGYFLPVRDEAFLGVTRDPNRTMLGTAQLEWIKTAVINSTARYKFIINPLPFTSLLVYPQDRWDGYAAERYDLLRALDLAGVEGVIVLSTDSHANTVNPDITNYLRRYLGQRFSRDFVVPELIAGPIGTGTLGEELQGVITSVLGGQGSLLARFAAAVLESYALLRTISANGLIFANADSYAYLVVDVTESGVTLTHRGIPSRGIVPVFPGIPVFASAITGLPASATTDTAPIRDLNTVHLDARGRAEIVPWLQLLRAISPPFVP